MGKERDDVKTYRVRAPVQRRVALAREAMVQPFAAWAGPRLARLSELSENGYAIVTLREGEKETTLVCRGLANEGNDFRRLFARLRGQGLLPRGAVVTHVFVRRALVWESIDVAKECFKSGDALVVVVLVPPLLKQSKRAIRKVRLD